MRGATIVARPWPRSLGIRGSRAGARDRCGRCRHHHDARDGDRSRSAQPTRREPVLQIGCRTPPAEVGFGKAGSRGCNRVLVGADQGRRRPVPSARGCGHGQDPSRSARTSSLTYAARTGNRASVPPPSRTAPSRSCDGSSAGSGSGPPRCGSAGPTGGHRGRPSGMDGPRHPQHISCDRLRVVFGATPWRPQAGAARPQACPLLADMTRPLPAQPPLVCGPFTIPEDEVPILPVRHSARQTLWL